jgi:putative ABC transport system permease protein
MSIQQIILRTLKHYPRSSMATAAGIAVATAIICGALIIGPSLTRSLENIVGHRLGEITHTLTAGDRLFTTQLADGLNAQREMPVASAVMQTEAIVSVQDRDARINKVQVWGVDEQFMQVMGSQFNPSELQQGHIAISENLAAALRVEVDDFVLMRLRTLSSIPANTPFVSEEGQTITRRVRIAKILSREQSGHFNLQSSQSAPYNIFLNLNWLNTILDLDGMANMLILNAPSGTDTDDFTRLIRDAVTLQDLGLQLNQAENDNQQWVLTSSRVFIDDYVGNEILSRFPDAQPYLTYFANSLEYGNRQTPYSFVTATALEEGKEMVINQWLADDLQLVPGDSVLMRWFVVGPLRELEEFEQYFRVASVLPMEAARQDVVLMPHLPGLSDAGSCHEWETGIPIDLDRIRNHDEAYWNEFRGTPKAYISLAAGQQLWQNRFGNLTTIIFSNRSKDEIEPAVTAAVDPARLGFRINAVKEEGLAAARGGVDFGQLFAGLGMFVIISGMLLTVLLLQFTLQKRTSQIQLFASLGFSKTLIHKILLGEAFVIVSLGAFAGLLLSVIYTRWVFEGLNKIWFDIVRTETLQIYYSPLHLIAGFMISVLLGMLVVWAGSRKIIQNTLQNSAKTLKQKKSRTIIWFSLANIFTILFIGVALYAAFVNADMLFLAGILLLGAMLLWIRYGLIWFLKPGMKLSVNLLSLKNLTRNPVRSFTIITLLAVGSFSVVLTAANRKDINIDLDRKGGTGGFTLMAQTTVPVLHNLALDEVREENNLPQHLHIVPFMAAHDDDASCHNLNRVANPRVLAVNPGLLEGRFSFAASHPLLDKTNPWLSLEREDDYIIPAIADQSVIQWGLGKKVGDTLFYLNEKGNQIRLLLIGGLENSVLQGNVVISQKHFLRHFPAGGAELFLIESQDDLNAVIEQLNFNFREYGWESETTQSRLASFNSVENTYLQIFFLMGSLGMLLGTIGLAVLIARGMTERRDETLMLRALGYSNGIILRLYFTEYTSLLMAGMIAGIIPALVATLPSWLAGMQNINPWFLPAVVLVILLNGLIWNLAIPVIMLRADYKIER